MNNWVINKKIEKARMMLMSKNSFFGTILLGSKVFIDHSIKTMATNGMDIYVSPEFVSEIDIDHVVFGLTHELYHKIMMHNTREGSDKHHETWNIAADLAIHSNMAKNKKFLKIITDNNYYYAKIFDNMTTEEIYWFLMSNKDILEDQQKKNGFDSHKKEKQSEKQKNDIANSVRAGLKISSCSEGDTDLVSIKKEFIRATKSSPQIKDGLRKFFEISFARHDYDFSVPDRRFISSGFCIPSIVEIQSKSRMKKVTVVLDVSASIPKHTHVFFTSIVSDLSKEFCNEIHLLFVDNSVRDYKVYTSGIDEIEIPCGISTDFRPAFNFVRDNCIDTKFLIYLTDLEVSGNRISDFIPEYNVLWVKTTESKYCTIPEFGDVIELDF